jgi:NAD(P)-dependent dehydrogenase (short-subunit alcohol dehydrogenase family)
MGLLDNKITVITGGTSGIGARTAALFAAEGASVVIAGRRTEQGQAMAARLGASFIRTDVSVESDVQALIAHTVDRHGRLDVLVNNAGDYGTAGSITEVDLQQFERTMAVHVGGVVAGMKYAAPVMIRQKSGSIINLASIGGQLAGWTGLDYSAAKAAILQLTRSAAGELGEHGIRVNTISPGPVLTGIFAKGAGMDPAQADRSAAALEPLFTAALKQWQPIHRAGTPDDVAPAALWLASDASSFINGHNLVVDGGISAGRPVSISLGEAAAMAQVFTGRTS